MALGSTRTLVASDYLHVDYLRQLESVEQLNYGKLIYRLNYTFVRLLGRIVWFDIGTVGMRHDDAIQVTQSLIITRRPPIWRRKFRYHLMSYVMLVLYILLGGHLLINLIYQYEYDFSWLRLRRLKSEPSFSRSNETLKQVIRQLEAKMAQSALKLDLIGAPHRHYTIAIECLHFCMLGLTLLTVFMSHVFFRFIRVPFDLQIIREQLDFESEQVRTWRMIESKVYEFLESSEIFSHISNRDSWARDSNFCWFGASKQEPAEEVARRQHQFEPMVAQELLLELFESGALKPINRSLEWFDKRSRLVFYYLMGTILYQTIYFSYIFLKVSDLTDNLNTQPESWPDFVIHCSFAILLVFIGIVSCSYSAYFSVACIDEIVAANKVSQLIGACISTNSRLFEQLLDHRYRAPAVIVQQPTIINSIRRRRRLSNGITKRRKSSAHQQQQQQQEFTGKLGEARAIDELNPEYSSNLDKMNTNLLFVLMHYKIFVAQHMPTKRTIEPGLLFITIFLMIIPIIVKLHIPYLVLVNANLSIRFFSAFLCLGTLGPANSVSLPLCYMHARCVGLHKKVSSLMAHVAEIESTNSRRRKHQQQSIYDGHLVTILLKELRHPERFINQFKPRCFGIDGSFTAHLKIVFWWGLIVISIIYDTQSNTGGLFESLFSDPLGVF